MVTAKHILESQDNNFLSEIYIRVNTSQNSASILEVDLTKFPILVHPDEKRRYSINSNGRTKPKFFRCKSYYRGFFCTAEIIKKEGISERDEVFFTGLFAPFIGETKDYPLVRFGKLSLLTDEKIEIQKYGEPRRLADLYLVECQSQGGFSGSPVFFYLNPIRRAQIHSAQFYLASVMKGLYNDFRINRVLELKELPMLK